MNSDRWFRDAESRIYRAQYDAILEALGKDAADGANYGWGVDSGDDYVQVSTKVYANGSVLTSTAVFGKPLDHDWK